MKACLLLLTLTVSLAATAYPSAHREKNAQAVPPAVSPAAAEYPGAAWEKHS